MTLPLISVIVPTVPGREDHLGRCVAAYTSQAPGNYQLDLIVEHDHPAVGIAWQAGADKARGEYVHLANDDIEPRPGWHAPAIEAVQRGHLPAPQVYGPAGELQSLPEWGKAGTDWAPVAMTTLPFCSAAQWEKIGPLFAGHYYCVVPETLILTTGMEWVPAGKLSVGDGLVAVDEFPDPLGDRKFRTATVTGADRRALECLTVYLEDGREITCSRDHAWLVRTQRCSDISNGKKTTLNWINTARLQPGDKIASPLRTWEAEASFEAGWLSGIFDGEGSAGRYGSRRWRHTTLSVAQNPGPVLDRITLALDSMGIRYIAARNASASRVTRIQISSIASVLETLGRLRPIRLSPDGLWEGASMRTKAPDQYGVVREVAPAGVCEVAAIGTSTGTFMANGLVSHNSDDFFSYRGRKAGWGTVLRPAYAFAHHWAQVRRGAGMTEAERMEHDKGLYDQAVNKDGRGEWP